MQRMVSQTTSTGWLLSIIEVSYIKDYLRKVYCICPRNASNFLAVERSKFLKSGYAFQTVIGI